jgi:drug/metabolite transporter (DMT)-like permease
VEWLIINGLWIAGAVALVAGLLLFLRDTFQAIRLRASVLGLLLVAASLILWPARNWIAHHRPPADPLINSIITVALWSAIIAIPVALVGRPRLIPVILLASLGSLVFWFTTSLPHDTSALSALRLSRPGLTGAQPPASPRPRPGTSAR